MSGIVTDSQLIDRAQGIASNLSYNESPEGDAKHMLKELCHRLGARSVRIHKKRDGFLIIDMFGKSRYMTRKESFLWRFFKQPPVGMLVAETFATPATTPAAARA